MYLDATNGTPAIGWTFFLPAAMNGGFTILPHCGQEYNDIPGVGLEMYLDGADMGLVQCPVANPPDYGTYSPVDCLAGFFLCGLGNPHSASGEQHFQPIRL